MYLWSLEISSTPLCVTSSPIETDLPDAMLDAFCRNSVVASAVLEQSITQKYGFVFWTTVVAFSTNGAGRPAIRTNNGSERQWLAGG